jgi:hypothetical protein
MKKNKIALFIFAISLSIIASGQAKFDLNEAIQVASSHYKNSLRINTDSSRIPRSTNADGTLKLVKSPDWCSGFFAGSLWLLYDLNQDAFWKMEAIKWTAALEKEKNNKKMEINFFQRTIK